MSERGVIQANDVIFLLGEVIQLAQAHEVEKAALKIREAENRQMEAVFEVKSEQIAEINRDIQKIKRQREQLSMTIKNLPESEQFFAQQQVEDVIEQYLSEPLAKLRKQKRLLSRCPRNG